MRRLIFSGLLVGISVLLAACGSVTAPTPTPSKLVNIKVETNPTPAMKGDMELMLIITDASGNPIEGAKVDVSADHTDMMGMGMSGPATDRGSGKYAINANFSMSGDWKLTIYVRKDVLDYKEDIEFKVQ